MADNKKRKLNDQTPAPPLSAFAAARQAAFQQIREVEEYDSDVDSDLEVKSEDDLPGSIFVEYAQRNGDLSESPSEGEIEDEEKPLQRAVIDAKEFSMWIAATDKILPCTARCVSIHMDKGEFVTFVGQYDLRVKSGAVSIYGAFIRQSDTIHRVFAPSTHALPSIKALAPNTVIDVCQSEQTLSKLSKLSPLFSGIWSKTNDNDPQIPDHVNQLSRHSFGFVADPAWDYLKRPFRPLFIDESYAWTTLLNRLGTPLLFEQCRPHVLICGMRNVGKSTFARMLLNKLTTQHETTKERIRNSVVWYLDLDPGQPEFSPPGQISLVQVTQPIIGPPYSHPFITKEGDTNHIVRAHCLANTTPMEDPEHYLACVADLIAYYKTSSFATHLVTNCPGWIRSGTGLEVMAQIIKRSSVTEVVYIGRPEDSSSIQHSSTLVAATSPNAFHVIPPQKYGLSSRSAAEMRAMQTMSYFHVQATGTLGCSWSSQPLFLHDSTDVHYGAQKPDIVGILTLGEQPPIDHVWTVLDGCVVAIVVLEDSTNSKEFLNMVQHTPNEHLPIVTKNSSDLPCPPSPSSSHCIGFALIKAIDVEREVLSLQTPLPLSRYLSSHNQSTTNHNKILLVRGSFDTPGWAYTQQIHAARKRQEKLRRRSSSFTQRPDDQTKSLTSQGDAAIESLAVDVSVLPTKYDQAASEDEDEAAFEVPWVKRLENGEVLSKSWKVTRTFARPPPPKKVATSKVVVAVKSSSSRSSSAKPGARRSGRLANN